MARREEKDKRREKKDRKKKWLKTQPSVEDPTRGESDLKRGRALSDSEDDEEDDDDWDELAKEERMAKKVRRGDISQGAFDLQFGDL